MKLKTLGAAIAIIAISFFLSSCKDENATNTPQAKPFELFSALSPEVAKLDSSVTAIIKIASMYGGTLDIYENTPKFIENSWAWAYLTDGKKFITADIECNGARMKDMSEEKYDAGQYEYWSKSHIKDYKFFIPNYLGEDVAIEESNAPTIKLLGYKQDDIISKSKGFTIKYDGYDPKAPISFVSTADGKDGYKQITKEISANGSMYFSQTEIEELMQTDEQGKPFIRIGLIQNTHKVVESKGGNKFLILFESMSSIRLRVSK